MGKKFLKLLEVQDQVKVQLQNSNMKYKEVADQKRREVQFKVGDLVWAYLKKERLPQTKHTKLLPKKVGPCQILEKYGHNAYKIQLPADICISPIFNVCDLTRYKGSETQAAHEDSVTEDLQQVPKPAPPQLEKILDTKIKKTRRRQYTQYLVKWKNKPVTEAIWMDEKQISKHGSSVQDLISSGLEILSTGEYAAVAGRQM